MKKQKGNFNFLSDQEKNLRIKSLEKALELEILRSRGFEVMIDVAEKQLTSRSEKSWHQTVSVLREEFPKLVMESLCGLFGYNRQAYYQYVTENKYRENAIIPLIVDAVRKYRKDAPRIGSLKLHYLISNLFKDEKMPG